MNNIQKLPAEEAIAKEEEAKAKAKEEEDSTRVYFNKTLNELGQGQSQQVIPSASPAPVYNPSTVAPTVAPPAYNDVPVAPPVAFPVAPGSELFNKLGNLALHTFFSPRQPYPQRPYPQQPYPQQPYPQQPYPQQYPPQPSSPQQPYQQQLYQQQPYQQQPYLQQPPPSYKAIS